jgi:hypothetical protein
MLSWMPANRSAPKSAADETGIKNMAHKLATRDERNSKQIQTATSPAVLRTKSDKTCDHCIM